VNCFSHFLLLLRNVVDNSKLSVHLDDGLEFEPVTVRVLFVEACA
jgi:hypothetical protein